MLSCWSLPALRSVVQRIPLSELGFDPTEERTHVGTTLALRCFDVWPSFGALSDASLPPY